MLQKVRHCRRQLGDRSAFKESCCPTGALAAAVVVVPRGYSQAALSAAIAVLAIGFVGIRVSARTPARSYIDLVLAIVLIAVSLTAILIAPLIALLSGLLLFIAFAGMGRGYQGDQAI